MHISFIHHDNRAPEHRFPYALNDCFDTLTWVGAVHTCIHVVTQDRSTVDFKLMRCSAARMLSHSVLMHLRLSSTEVVLVGT